MRLHVNLKFLDRVQAHDLVEAFDVYGYGLPERDGSVAVWKLDRPDPGLADEVREIIGDLNAPWRIEA